MASPVPSPSAFFPPTPKSHVYQYGLPMTPPQTPEWSEKDRSSENVDKPAERPAGLESPLILHTEDDSESHQRPSWKRFRRSLSMISVESLGITGISNSPKEESIPLWNSSYTTPSPSVSLSKDHHDARSKSTVDTVKLSLLKFRISKYYSAVVWATGFLFLCILFWFTFLRVAPSSGNPADGMIAFKGIKQRPTSLPFIHKRDPSQSLQQKSTPFEWSSHEQERTAVLSFLLYSTEHLPVDYFLAESNHVNPEYILDVDLSSPQLPSHLEELKRDLFRDHPVVLLYNELTSTSKKMISTLKDMKTLEGYTPVDIDARPDGESMVMLLKHILEIDSLPVLLVNGMVLPNAAAKLQEMVANETLKPFLVDAGVKFPTPRNKKKINFQPKNI